MAKRNFDYFSKKTKENLVIYLKKIIEIIKKPEMGILPGQIAFSMLISIVPIVTIIGFIASFFGIDINYIIGVLNEIIPGDGASVLAPALNGASIDLGLALIFIWLFYLGSNACNSIILISNQIYGINQSNSIKRRIKAIFMTIAIMLIFIVILVFQVFGDRLIGLLSFLAFYDKIYSLFNIIKGPIVWIAMFIFLRAFYSFAPDRVRKKTHINTGTVFTALGWIVVTNIYRFIALNNGNYNLFYGALSNIAFLMLWLYFMSFVFVIGLSLNYGEEKDKTIMDKTGAVKIIKNK
ncbi:MAG: YihY/virulence factor BrkB family protein [Bacilli bacterium]|jgi:membrane protein|nr:YihY/virulence factor BrkB family protein [Bacilli bacterium]